MQQNYGILNKRGDSSHEKMNLSVKYPFLKLCVNGTNLYKSNMGIQNYEGSCSELDFVSIFSLIQWNTFGQVMLIAIPLSFL